MTSNKLIDEYGRIVDLNNMDYSFALEIEQLNKKYLNNNLIINL